MDVLLPGYVNSLYSTTMYKLIYKSFQQVDGFASLIDEVDSEAMGDGEEK